jgi:pimeloyl-ACP methyl ester carboxylesterase
VWDESGEELLSLWRLVLRWRVPGLALSTSIRSLADTLMSGDTGWWGHQAAFGFDLTDALSRLTHPLAIVNPGDDLCEASRRAHAIRPDAVFVEKPEWSHGFIHKFPDEAAALLAGLLTAPA